MVMLAAGLGSAATAFKWTGGKQPGKLTTPKTGQVNIGEFINLASKEEWGQVVFNIANKYPGSKPWITWGVGTWPEHSQPITDAQSDEALKYLDDLGVQIFLEVRPGSANVVSLIDTYVKRYSSLKNLRGFGVDLEFYTWKGNKDADAKLMDDKLKSFNPDYRMFFKHWEATNMPKNNAKGDMIYFATSSEDAIPGIIAGHSKFANTLAPSAVAFQIGYPADEPLKGGHVHFSTDYDGWGKMQDPIKEWGDGLLKAVTSNTQELGFVWVTVKSERIPWDLTKGANIPTFVAVSKPFQGRFLRVERNGSRLTLRLGGGADIIVPAAADIMGRKVTIANATGPAGGRYYLQVGGETAAWTEFR
ncbi:MAG: hypothetical protein JWO30_2360 [Fibrobacteres bacterium]|nr:hypothetical protein [Fibrobacterota bacterium]